MRVKSPDQEDPLREVSATHDLPGEIPQTEEPEAAVYRVTKSWT